MASTSLLLISNGHGEDAVGARLARALHQQRPDLHLQAFPTVGSGRGYQGAPVELTGPLRALPSDGMTFRSVEALLGDLRAGILSVTVAQLRSLRALSPALVISVGDVWAEAMALLPRTRNRYAVQTLVSERLNDGRLLLGPSVFRQRFTRIERTLLVRSFRRVFVRDPDSDAALRRGGVDIVRYLGNPMRDELDVDEPGRPPLELRRPVVALLPGTRRHAQEALERMLDASSRLAPHTLLLPWAREEEPRLPPRWSRDDTRDGVVRYRDAERGGVALLRTDFADALAHADVAVGAAGTAQEQAASIGVPVVAFPCGPEYTPAFLASQQRLLGASLMVVEGTPQSLATAVNALLSDPDDRRRRGDIGRERMGPAGASHAIAAEVIADAVSRGVLASRRAEETLASASGGSSS